MPRLDSVALTAWAIVKHNNLVAPALLDNCRFDLSPADRGLAHLHLVRARHEQNIVQNNLIADLMRQRFDANLFAEAGAKLLSAYLKNCIHDDTPDVVASPLRVTPRR
jgi:hypothetical protein